MKGAITKKQGWLPNNQEIKMETKQEIIKELISLNPYLNNKKTGLNNMKVYDLKGFLEVLKSKKQKSQKRH